MSFRCRKSPIEKIVIASPCDYELFYGIGLIIEGLGARFTQRLIDLNHLYWTFVYSGQNFILHYDLNTGTYIYPSQLNSSDEESELVSQIAGAVSDILEKSYDPDRSRRGQK